MDPHLRFPVRSGINVSGKSGLGFEGVAVKQGQFSPLTRILQFSCLFRGEDSIGEKKSFQVVQ